MALTIGVDVGGTKIAAGVVDDAGAILARTRVPAQPEVRWADPSLTVHFGHRTPPPLEAP